jgi:hypothetical protein
MKKSVAKQLKKVADQLPIYFVQSHEIHVMTGQEILDETEFKEIGGKPINPEEKYAVPMPVQIAFNHHRKLKEIYSKFGLAGVKEYSEKIIAQTLLNTVNNG